MSSRTTSLEPQNGVQNEYDVPLEVQQEIATIELQTWKNTVFQLEMRLKTERRVGGRPDQQAYETGLLRDIDRAHKMVREYQAELDALKGKQ